MDGFGPFVGDDALEIECVTNGRVLRGDARAAEQISSLARYLDGGAKSLIIGDFPSGNGDLERR